MIKLYLRSIALGKHAFEAAWPEYLFHEKSLVGYMSIGTVKKKNNENNQTLFKKKSSAF